MVSFTVHKSFSSMQFRLFLLLLPLREEMYPKNILHTAYFLLVVLWFRVKPLIRLELIFLHVGWEVQFDSLSSFPNTIYWKGCLFPVVYSCLLCCRLIDHIVKVDVVVALSCLTLCHPVDCSPPGSSVHGILQARILDHISVSLFLGCLFCAIDLGICFCAGTILFWWL